MSDEALSGGEAVGPIEIDLLGKSYRIACRESERESLLASARYLDRKMREIRDTGRIIGQDRIAVIAALEIAHELVQAKNCRELPSREFCSRLAALRKKIDNVLDQSGQQ